MIRALIVDDEPLARAGIRLLLETEPDVEVVGEADNGPRAVEAVRQYRPDLMFLDVQMPGLDGFGVVEAIADDHLPLIVFSTAYDEYAVRAFEIHALDYLLKPLHPDRFRATLRRVRQELKPSGGGGKQRLADWLTTRDAAPAAARRFAVRQKDRYLLLKAEEIDWAESAGNYVRLHARQGEFLLRSSLADLEHRLDPSRFARIHRSRLVNLDRVKEIQPLFQGDFEVVLNDGTRLRLSRTHRDRVIDGRD